MKCPKCGYLGFETTDRCRHCGYDFSLSAPVDPTAELPLRSANELDAPLADFDLDRIFGEPQTKHAPDAVAVATPPPSEVQQHYQPEPEEPAALPLFTRAQPHRDDGTAITTPPPARPPLAVRRATPEVARRRTPRTIRRGDDAFELQLEPDAPAPFAESNVEEPAPATVSNEVPTARRIAAALVDLFLLGSINVVVLYLTLAIAGLSFADVLVLPAIPMAGFLLLLNGGYLVAFTAASGQTIGKMLFGVRVIADDNGRIEIAGAVLRAAGVLLTLVTLGLPYLPVLLSPSGRALHDRLAGTRVVKHA